MVIFILPITCNPDASLSPPFLQALEELKASLGLFLESNPNYKKALDIVQIPERVLQFRVVWEDDQGVPQVNRGYRVQVRIYIHAYHRLIWIDKLTHT